MSLYYTKNNIENSLELFNKRTLYKDELQRTSPANVVDFFEGEKILYGRLSQRFVPISINQSHLKIIKGKAPQVTLYAVNFVADVFKEMVLQFQKSMASGQITTTDPFLSQLKAYKAYVNPHTVYNTYTDAYYKEIARNFRILDIKVKNFDEFIENLLPVIKNALPQNPLTFPGFIKSTACSTLSTGLAIEIADLKYADDEEKISKFVKSKNYAFFVNACNSYGFMIDYNVPWRIVADLKSDIMKEIASRYGYPSFLMSGFDNTGVIYFRKFIYELKTLYDRVRVPYFTELEECSDGTIKERTITPQQYTESDLNYRYSLSYFLKIYLMLRIEEEQPELSPAMKQNIIREYIEVTKATRSLRSVTQGFESVINKTFDKRGSASYIKKEIKAQAEVNFARGDIDNLTLNDLYTADDFSNY
jgi:hypothetical protein|tara:strand:- start:1992 stop:3248 length:1257 start_codon:yes stop_codon:yes gene_type:complete